MKKTLSFWQRACRGLCWVGSGFRAFWRVGPRFYFSPTERNLLLSFWYDYHHFRRVQPAMSIDDYLDWRVRDIKRIMLDLRRSVKTRQLHGDLLQALGDKNIRSMFVNYLRAASPAENYPEVVAAIRAAWRPEGVKQVPAGNEPVLESNETVADAAVEERGNGIDEAVEREVPALHAKAYVIAAHLDAELTDKESDFVVLSLDLAGLMKYVEERFGVKKLPGTFEKFKGYSYKLILDDRSGPKKGQLQKPLRQIRDHPEIFGEAVAARAAEILRLHFK